MYSTSLQVVFVLLKVTMLLAYLRQLTPQTARKQTITYVCFLAQFKEFSCLHFVSFISISLPILVMHQVRGYSREELELGCGFLGLVVLHNKVKPQTAPALATLHNAHLTTVMLTGTYNTTPPSPYPPPPVQS